MHRFEFLIPKRPVSLQTKNRRNLQSWKSYVRHVAAQAWPSGVPAVADAYLCLSIVYLCDSSPADIDNIIKPIQDALVGLAFRDDFLVSDVDSHRRFLSEPIDLVELPPLLRLAAARGEECLYVRVCEAAELRSYL